MRVSARNQIAGTVVSLTRGPVSVLVKLDVGGGNHITATLTAAAADDLGLVEGAQAIALFKASAVMLGTE